MAQIKYLQNEKTPLSGGVLLLSLHDYKNLGGVTFPHLLTLRTTMILESIVAGTSRKGRRRPVPSSEIFI